MGLGSASARDGCCTCTILCTAGTYRRELSCWQNAGTSLPRDQHPSSVVKPPSSDRPFAFLRSNTRESKPRTQGITEIRGPYYTPVGPRYLEWGRIKTFRDWVADRSFMLGREPTAD